MEKLNLSQIIEINSDPQKSVLFESVNPYLKSLYVFYKDLFCCEPILMVTDVFNAAQYVKIVPSDDFNEAVCDYIGDDLCTNEESENFSTYETINFSSKLLKDFLI